MARKSYGYRRVKPPEWTHIYTLSDPDTGEVRYVGKSDNPEERLKNHISECRRSYASNRYRGPQKLWVASLLEQGKRPRLSVVERCKQQDSDKREVYWVAKYLNEGANLTNTHYKTGIVTLKLAGHTKKQIDDLARATGMSSKDVVTLMVDYCLGKIDDGTWILGVDNR